MLIGRELFGEGRMNDLFVPLDDHPAYRQIANLIEERIVGASLRTGDPLPSETDLARQFGVNRSTIREAIRELEIHGLLGRGRGEKRLRVTRPEPRRVSSGREPRTGLARCDFFGVVGGHDGALNRPRRNMRRRGAPRRSCKRLARAGERFKRAAADTDAAVAAVVDFFTAVAAASGNQVLALSQAPLNLLLAPTLTRILDRVPQARARIVEAQGKIISGDQAQEKRAGAHLDGEAHPRFQARPRSGDPLKGER